MTRIEEITDALRKMPDRGKISLVLNQFGLTDAAAEIGVDRGNYAAGILAFWKGRTYYAVDLWGKQDVSVYAEDGIFDHEFSFRCASEFASREPRMKIMRMLSVDAAKLIPDESLDWVWIDANHQFQPVLDDMNAWWPKVKRGGVFSGHDYPLPEVTAAVGQWMKENNQTFIENDSSWWMVKP